MAAPTFSRAHHQQALHHTKGRNRGFGIASDGLLDDFVIEDVSVVNVVAHFEAIGDVLCHGGSECFELAVPRWWVVGAIGGDYLADCRADFCPHVGRNGYWGLGVCVNWVHSNDATKWCWSTRNSLRAHRRLRR